MTLLSCSRSSWVSSTRVRRWGPRTHHAANSALGATGRKGAKSNWHQLGLTWRECSSRFASNIRVSLRLARANQGLRLMAREATTGNIGTLVGEDDDRRCRLAPSPTSLPHRLRGSARERRRIHLPPAESQQRTAAAEVAVGVGHRCGLSGSVQMKTLSEPVTSVPRRPITAATDRSFQQAATWSCGALSTSQYRAILAPATQCERGKLSLGRALLHGSTAGAQSAPGATFYVRRTYSGRPSSSMRFSEAAAMATSVICRPPVRERSASPITRL